MMTDCSLGGRVFDAIVVGSGAAGGFAARTLTEAGLDTLVLEAGPDLDPRDGFPAPGAGDGLASLRAAMWRQPIQARCTSFKGFVRHLYVDDRDNPYTTAPGKPFYWIRGRQVGGRLLTWACLAPRLSDYELLGASHDGCGEDWPFSYAEIAPYYDKVEECLGLYGQADGLPQLPDGRYLGPRELSPQELELKSVVESRWPEIRVLQARVVAHNPQRTSSALREARKTDRLTLRPNAVVRRITTDRRSGKANGVEFVDRLSGQPQHVSTRLVFLCASAFESVRILLNSASERHPDGLGGSSGVLGRYITDHLFFVRSGRLPEGRGGRFGVSGDPYDFGAEHGFYVPRFRNIQERHADFIRGYGLFGAIGRRGPIWWIGAFGEMLPRADNRITLNPRKKDKWGVPVAHIECTHCANDRALIADARRVVDEIVAAAGLPDESPWSKQRLKEAIGRKSFVEPGVLRPGLSIHELGGARMSREPRAGVLNPFGRCWEAENVVVADGACFVSSAYQNPTLTIMALAVRAAERAVSDYEEITL
jgi:choline dehydrogenase-like flavoprotein